MSKLGKKSPAAPGKHAKSQERLQFSGKKPLRGVSPGKNPASTTLQFSNSDGQVSADAVHAAAASGVSGSGQALPFADRIQSSFGHHDIGDVRAHVGGAAATANQAMGSQAFATGSDVAFAGSPDLHTAAHEAAHVVQQKGGVQLKGGVGESGDSHEQHADAVADKVVSGASAEGLLDQVASSGASGGGVQHKAVQFWSGHEHRAIGNMAAIIATGSANFDVASFRREHGNRDFSDPEAMGFFGGSQPLTDPVLQDLERRGANAQRVRTNDTVHRGRHGMEIGRSQNSISFGAASELAGDFNKTTGDLAREDSSDNPNGNDYLVVAQIAQTNINHFFPLNGAEYQNHHGKALAAAQAGNEREALLEEGFASHFLEDCYAAGHMAPRALDRSNLSDMDQAELGLNRTKDYHDTLNAVPGSGLPTTRGNFHGDDTMTGNDLATMATDVGASLREVLTTLAGRPEPANIALPAPDFSAIMASPAYSLIWTRMMNDYEEDLRDAESGRAGASQTTDGGTPAATRDTAAAIRSSVYGGRVQQLVNLGASEWNGAILVFNLRVENRPAPVGTEVWIKWFDEDCGNDRDLSGRETGTLANDRTIGLRDTDEEIGGPDRVRLEQEGLGSARGAADDTNDTYAVFYSDAGCTVPIGRTLTQGNARGRVSKPVQVSGYVWSGNRLSFQVTRDGNPVSGRTLHLRWYNEDSSNDCDSRGNLSQTIVDTDSPVGAIQQVPVSAGRAGITASGQANNSGDTYATLFLDAQCTIPLGRSPVQP